MADISLSAGTDYTRTILHSIRKITETCDFIITVDGKDFPVHRNVISAASSYFRAMFSSNMKEAQQGFAEVKTMKPAVMEKCIDFMYTGEVKVQMHEVQYILIASNLLQLDLLTEISFTHLQKNLSTSNCLVVSRYATVFNRPEVKNRAEQFIMDNFEDVISTDTFPTISFEDFSRYFFESVAGHEIKWGALVKWLSNKREETEPIYQKLLETLEYFPLNFLIKKALEGLMKKPVKKNNKTNNKMRRNLVLDFLFEDIEKFKREVNLENFWDLKKIIKIADFRNGEIVKIMDQFMEDNFGFIAQSNDFVDLNEREILFLFESTKTEYSSENIKWYAALRWSMHQPNRMNVFSQLFRLIKLDDLHVDFLQNVVRNEPLVRESRECSVILMDHALSSPDPMGAQSSPARHRRPHLVCLDVKNGQIKALNVWNNIWHELPHAQNGDSIRIVNVNNSLYVISKKKVHQLKGNEWTIKTSIPTMQGPYVPVSCHEKIYLIQTMNMSCFDTIQNGWENKLPGCGLGVGFCAAAIVNSVYAMGGIDTDCGVMKFDSETQSWSNLCSMQNGRRNAAAAELGGNIYVTGGHSEANSVESYNLKTNTWATVAGLCVSRWDHRLCAIENKLYAVGGKKKGGNKNTNSIEVYDEDSKHWSKVNVDELPKNSSLEVCAYFM
ncbi:uncharacterized protein LOC120337683 [Styela clava]